MTGAGGPRGPSPRRRILLTGATGFIGASLARAFLDEGHAVCALVRSTARREEVDPRARVAVHDGTTEGLAAAVAGFRPDVAVHAATHYVAGHTAADVAPLIAANLLVGTQLLDALARAGVTALVNFGTAWQHAPGGGYAPRSLYVASKQAFEDILAFYAASAGVRAITLKLADTYGPRDRRRKLVGLLFAHARSGEPLALSPGDQRLSLVHVADVIGAVRVACARLDRERDASDLGHADHAVRGDEVLSLREIVALFEASTGLSLDARWGARPYRDNEVMEPWLGPTLPGWAPGVSLRAGFRDLARGGHSARENDAAGEGACSR